MPGMLQTLVVPHSPNAKLSHIVCVVIMSEKSMSIADLIQH